MMDQPPMTCELVNQRELDRRYLAGQLSEEEATAFEAHYFECDRCWELVKSGAGVRATLKAGCTLAAAPVRAWWRPLALAAALVLVFLGTWRVVGSRGRNDPDAIRGARDSIAVRSELSAGLWRTSWPTVSGAASYRVRVFDADGRLLLTRESSDTNIELPADSLSTLGGGGTLYLDIQGFDQLRRPVARSPLTPLLPLGAPR